MVLPSKLDRGDWVPIHSSDSSKMLSEMSPEDEIPELELPDIARGDSVSNNYDTVYLVPPEQGYH